MMGGWEFEAMEIDTDKTDQIDELMGWWKNLAEDDAAAVVPKALEYGGYDFDIMGAAMMSLRGDHWVEADAGERMKIAREMAVMFYILGKVARAMSAYGEGKLPSDDTLKDIAVYGMMVRRIRETGMWV